MQAQSRFMAAPSEPRRKRDFGKIKMDHASFADRLGAGDAFGSHLTATAVVEDYPNRGAPTAAELAYNHAILATKDHWVYQNRDYDAALRAIVCSKLASDKLDYVQACASLRSHFHEPP